MSAGASQSQTKRATRPPRILRRRLRNARHSERLRAHTRLRAVAGVTGVCGALPISLALTASPAAVESVRVRGARCRSCS